MKLEKILGNLNSLEKNSFIKIVDGIIGNDSKNSKAIDKLLATTDSSGLKNADNVVIGKIFSFVENEYGINLYGFGGFYSEVWYNQKTNKVDKVRSFNNTSMLEPYLDDIEVDTF